MEYGSSIVKIVQFIGLQGHPTATIVRFACKDSIIIAHGLAHASDNVITDTISHLFCA